MLGPAAMDLNLRTPCGTQCQDRVWQCEIGQEPAWTYPVRFERKPDQKDRALDQRSSLSAMVLPRLSTTIGITSRCILAPPIKTNYLPT